LITLTVFSIVGLAILHGKYGDEFFRRAPLRQFKPGDGSHSQVVFIDSLASAKSAMKIIVDQGEGSGGVDGHYQIFKGLVRTRACLITTWSTIRKQRHSRINHSTR
jgi:hypothetical protein